MVLQIQKRTSLVILILSILGLIFYPPLTLGCGLVSLITFFWDREKFHSIPLKGFAVWIIAFYAAELITYLTKSYNIAQYVPTDIWLASTLLAVGTNFMTNTAITAIGLPLYLKAFSQYNAIDVMAWFLTLSGLSFALPVANGCLAVACGFGVKIREMAKVGCIIVFLHLVIFGIYYTTIGKFAMN